MNDAETPRPSRWYLPNLSGPVLGLLVVLGVFVALLGLKHDAQSIRHFLSMPNLQVLAHDGTITAVLALGMLLIMISGGIDLSVGSVVALVAVVTIWVYRWEYQAAIEHGLSDAEAIARSSLYAIPAGILVGGLCGLANGLIITVMGVTPFVATLGMLSVARGLAVWVAERRTMSFPLNARPPWVDRLAQVHPPHLFFNPGFWSVLVLAILVAILLHRTVLGRYTYAIGSNEATARLCGVHIGRTKVILYTLSGLLAGWAGVLLLAHNNSGDPSAALGLELEVIAAVVIGGASLNGGQGTVTGALLGVLILGVLTNGVRSFDVPVEIRYILIGIIIVVNTALSQWQQRRDGAA